MKQPESPTFFYDVSIHQSEMWFDDKPDNVAYFQHDFGSHQLEGQVLFNELHEPPWVISIHGARADYTKSGAVNMGMRNRGYSVLGINLSGHSGTGILPIEEVTLQNNVDEGLAFYNYLDLNRPKIVIGYSLGGTVALKLLELHSHNIDTLILFYPGVYSQDAYDKHFGQEFRDCISEPYSYKKNDTAELLKRFAGKLLLIKGEYDGLEPAEYGKPPGGSVGNVEIDGTTYYSPIPKEVIDLLFKAVPDERRALIEVPQCGHSVALWMRENKTAANQILDEVVLFINQK